MSRRHYLMFNLMRPKGGVSAASICRVWRIYKMRLDTFIVASKLDMGERIPHDAQSKLDYHMARLEFFLTVRLRETSATLSSHHSEASVNNHIVSAWRAVSSYFALSNACSDGRAFVAIDNLSYVDDLLRYAVASYYKQRRPK